MQARRLGPVALLVTLTGIAGCGGSHHSAPAGAAAGPQSIHAEIAITAHQAHWKPTGGGAGRLTLAAVSPRMTVMATAPRHTLAVMPASMLRANWQRLFAKTGGATNVVLAVDVSPNRPRRLVSMSVRLVGGGASGGQLVFATTPLRHAATAPDTLPAKAVTLGDPTLLVDPDITAAIKAMWQALVGFFSGQSFRVPPDPVSEKPDGTAVFDDGGSGGGDAVYRGPNSATIANADDLAALQKEILDEAGKYSASDFEGNPYGNLTFTDSSYDGLAVFGNNFGKIDFTPPSGRVTIENSALFGIHPESLSFANADLGGVNMRGTQPSQFTAENTLFQTVDMTGGAIGGTQSERSAITNSAFVDVHGDVAADDPAGNPDRFNDAGFNLGFTDFTSVSFQDSSFKKASISSTTFQGCGFSNVDFSGAQIRGADPASNGGKFQPTFDNSIMDGVKFDNATFQDVSFAGVDFSNVSLDGATLQNVDFTGATGLQLVDWSKVKVDGNVYGLEQYSHQLGELGNKDYIRSITFDGEVPQIDKDTGFDIDPHTGWLIDTGTGARLEKGPVGQGLIPIDPATGEPMRNPNDPRDVLKWEPGGVFDPQTNERFDVDYATGELAR